MSNRLFVVGIVLLLMGVQLRMVKSFELNDKASAYISSKLPKKPVPSTTFVSYDPFGDLGRAKEEPPAIRSVTPPRWLGWSFISIGATLVLTNPCFRR